MAVATQQRKLNEDVVYITFDYDAFSRLQGNRPVDEKHVGELVEKIKTKDLRVPIIVNQNFDVIDGQHRLEARRRIGAPVYYIGVRDTSLQDVQTLNAGQKDWTINDFVQSHIETGNQNYVIYKWFREHYRLPHNQSLILLSGSDSYDNVSRSLRKQFETGSFVVADLDGAKKVGDMLLKIQPHFDKWNSKGFVSALMFALTREGFDFNVLLHKIKQHNHLAYHCATKDLYVEMIEQAVNYRNSKKVSIKYGEPKTK